MYFAHYKPTIHHPAAIIKSPVKRAVDTGAPHITYSLSLSLSLSLQCIWKRPLGPTRGAHPASTPTRPALVRRRRLTRLPTARSPPPDRPLLAHRRRRSPARRSSVSAGQPGARSPSPARQSVAAGQPTARPPIAHSPPPARLPARLALTRPPLARRRQHAPCLPGARPPPPASPPTARSQVAEP
jgi:hypothetical protein